ncbi:putative hemin import ATP-binding protein HrtA [Melissococcus plutonius]|uniref:Putative hemin import ATP-binding protein HrtA n=1 Tax=Melissococcus plutonius (strain ATCC 35311 / DSM 29964 / CIP 104052 / LMG 20360 / NCIMB 702443) TaxID=940190 RepID=F3Y8L9_MELPT|nr:ABC transporter ATP-binding protein [Melissococcus plutonius]AIM24530.1 putative hemin import ATP-binding protein HrtA [Melissococcus plutonius S1]KMT24589.1 putative hemin import ATP-binding protein HrtA [Melissococcus plutonius]KMT27302.1 putative hemin import ATP-binding protein HrtA [Melissococcus plutonius]KMT27475.1 putative hemin import ATP-binding protein HrtA [Melissococcus plutonius]KMT29249.1 putative hemin import ATP-binding protein HrtA [Melissococcus plutonius]
MHTIEFKKVEKRFKDGDQIIQALKQTSISIDQGKFIAIVGPSGSGKSTFLTLAGGLQQPSRGEIFINGQPFSSKNERERSNLRFKEIGFILQSSNLVPFLTAKKQLILVDKVNRTNHQSYAISLFNQLGIAHLANKFPNQLSGGERQRVAIARALYNDPTIILADEPTASLDSKKAYEVVKILANETKEKNKAIVMVTHDTRLVHLCDTVFIMQDGVLQKANHPLEE